LLNPLFKEYYPAAIAVAAVLVQVEPLGQGVQYCLFAAFTY